VAWGVDCRTLTKLPFGKTCKITKLKEIAYGMWQRANYQTSRRQKSYKISRWLGIGDVVAYRQNTLEKSKAHVSPELPPYYNNLPHGISASTQHYN